MSKLKPGPELDALVAEKVMGWTSFPANHGWEFWGAHRGAPSDHWSKVPAGKEDSVDLFQPSTDIRAAWEVVEKVRGTSFRTPHPKWGPSNYPDGTGMVIMIDPLDCGVVWHGTRMVPENHVVAHHGIPHAICLAALKAVGEP